MHPQKAYFAGGNKPSWIISFYILHFKFPILILLCAFSKPPIAPKAPIFYNNLRRRPWQPQVRSAAPWERSCTPPRWCLCSEGAWSCRTPQSRYSRSAASESFPFTYKSAESWDSYIKCETNPVRNHFPLIFEKVSVRKQLLSGSSNDSDIVIESLFIDILRSYVESFIA